MRNRIIELLLLMLMNVILLLINKYCSICLLGCLILKLHDFNLIKLDKILLKLKIANLLYPKMDDKLNFISKNKLNFKNKSLYLKGKAKSKIEKMFFSSLANCNNKKQIDILIEWYHNRIKNHVNGLYIEGFLVSLFSLIIKIFFSYYINQLFHLILMISCVILLSYEIIKILNIYIEKGNNFYHFYIMFYRKLAYLSPLIAYSEALKKSSNKIFHKLFDDINEKRISSFTTDEEKNEFCLAIYQTCYTNSLCNEKKLKELYYLSLNKENLSLKIFYKYIFYILYIILIGVILI